ncbi:helix-hairpin-helix domain-containing protein, partial [Escherichia coli]|nr:helix-hairpin-helix domain-containing protein [Escherichia coli]
EQIEASKNRELRRLLYGLDIRHIGERNAAILAKYFRSIDRLAAATKEELEAIPDIGPVVAESVYEWFHNSRNLNLLEELRKAGVRMED